MGVNGTAAVAGVQARGRVRIHGRVNMVGRAPAMKHPVHLTLDLVLEAADVANPAAPWRGLVGTCALRPCAYLPAGTLGVVLDRDKLRGNPDFPWPDEWPTTHPFLVLLHEDAADRLRALHLTDQEIAALVRWRCGGE